MSGALTGAKANQSIGSGPTPDMPHHGFTTPGMHKVGSGRLRSRSAFPAWGGTRRRCLSVWDRVEWRVRGNMKVLGGRSAMALRTPYTFLTFGSDAGLLSITTGDLGREREAEARASDGTYAWGTASVVV